MTYASVLAQSTVADLSAVEPWYTALFDRGPDARPMDGLLEWHVTTGGGVQVWAEPGRAGRSTVVLADTRGTEPVPRSRHPDESGLRRSSPLA